MCLKACVCALTSLLLPLCPSPPQATAQVTPAPPACQSVPIAGTLLWAALPPASPASWSPLMTLGTPGTRGRAGTGRGETGKPGWGWCPLLLGRQPAQPCLNTPPPPVPLVPVQALRWRAPRPANASTGETERHPINDANALLKKRFCNLNVDLLIEQRINK